MSKSYANNASHDTAMPEVEAGEAVEVHSAMTYGQLWNIFKSARGLMSEVEFVTLTSIVICDSLQSV